jgi:ElaB/YqjD/DUF883 family membrane-anchored ribosome-binding protein
MQQYALRHVRAKGPRPMSDFESDSPTTAKNVADDLAMLKNDVAALIKQMKELAVREGSRIGQDAAERISGTAANVYDNVSKQGKRSAEAVSQHVEEQPISSLLIAFAAGFVFSKLFTR